MLFKANKAMVNIVCLRSIFLIIVVCVSDGIQLDWSSIAGWDYASIFAVAVRFLIQDQFWIPQSKLHEACIFDFFEKSKNELARPKMVFWRFQQKIDRSSIIAIYK